MVDEFERTMDLIFDRMEDNIKNYAVAETEAKCKISALRLCQEERDATIRTLQADLAKAQRDLEYAKHKMGFLEAQLASDRADLPKLSALWQTAETLLRACRSAKIPKNDILVEASDKLAKALNDAHSACDQIPF